MSNENVKLNGYANYNNYYSFSENSNEGMLLIGAKAGLQKSGTTFSAAIGPDWNTADGISEVKPILEFKVNQELFSTGNVNFKAQGRVRYTDNKTQIRGALTAEYPLKNGITPYVTGHYTTKNGTNKIGGWFGVGGKSWYTEVQADYNLNTKKTDTMWNVGFYF